MKHSTHAADIISDIPKVTRGQTEMLTGIGRQLEISNEQGIVASQTIDRLGATLRATIHDANTHFFRATSSYDFLQSDDTHPTYDGPTVYLGLLGGSGDGHATPRFPDDGYTRGTTKLWKKHGHDRMGWAMSTFHPASPDLP